MDSDELQSIYNDIVGKNQEHIILDYDAPFDISEYKNIFMLNETLENISDCGLENDMLTALLMKYHLGGMHHLTVKRFSEWF